MPIRAYPAITYYFYTMKTYQTLTAEIEENILILRLNRPEAMNALNAQMFDELDHFFSNDYKEHQMGCVILTGTGEKAFAAGADIKELHGDRKSVV